MYSVLGPKIQRRLMQHRKTKWVTSLVVSGGVDCRRRRRNVYDKWVFKWRLKVRMFSHSRILAGSRWMEQQQKKRDGPVRCVCEERRTSELSIGRAQNPRWCTGLYQLAKIRWSGCGPHLVMMMMMTMMTMILRPNFPDMRGSRGETLRKCWVRSTWWG